MKLYSSLAVTKFVPHDPLRAQRLFRFDPTYDRGDKPRLSAAADQFYQSLRISLREYHRCCADVQFNSYSV